MRMRLSKIHEKAKERAEGYVEALLSRSAPIDAEWIEISFEAANEVSLKYTGKEIARKGCEGCGDHSIVAQPRDRWPQEARILAAAAIHTDTGLGDVYARKIAGDDAERWRELAAKLARGCGCAGNRVGWLNARFPLDY